eukprot:959534-Heterocapsa_arctica.AAC.1
MCINSSKTNGSKIDSRETSSRTLDVLAARPPAQVAAAAEASFSRRVEAINWKKKAAAPAREGL